VGLRGIRDSSQAITEMRGFLSHNVAHDLRTPLASIRGYTRMILDRRAGEINDTQRNYLTVVSENTTKLINMVNWMSHVFDLNQQQLRASAFDLRAVWADALASSQPALSAKRARLTEQVPAEPLDLVADRPKLTYAFRALIAQALNFTNEDGKLHAEFFRGREGEINFRLSTTGPEISQDSLVKILDRSYNAAKPVAEQGENTELSLADMYDIVGMHGGRVFVTSKPGEGSIFLFTLPVVGNETHLKRANSTGEAQP
jgi:signal transduction histidine kinase